MASNRIPLAARVLLTAGHVALLNRDTLAAAASGLSGVVSRLATVVPAEFSIADPAIRVTARLLERALPIERICDMRMPTLGLVAPPSSAAFVTLLEGAWARSELMTFAACAPLARAARAAGGNLGLETIASIGRKANIEKRIYEVIQRETLVIRLTEELVLPCLTTIEALAEVGVGRTLPLKRPRTLGEAANRLKNFGLDETFVDANFCTIRNGAAHAGASFDSARGLISFKLINDKSREISAEVVAQTLMLQPAIVHSYLMLAMNFALDRYLGGDNPHRHRAADAIKGALRLAAAGRYPELRRRFHAVGDAFIARQKSHSAEELESAKEFAKLWR